MGDLFELSVKRHFAAAHRLEGYQGQCSALHGHTWTVEVVVSGSRLDSCGMLVDFRIIKETVDGIVIDLDHGYLNDIVFFSGGDPKNNPTAENIAFYIFGRVKEQMVKLSPGLMVRHVRVWESPDASALYREGF